MYLHEPHKETVSPSTITTLYRVANLLSRQKKLEELYDLPTTLFEELGLDPSLAKNALAAKAKRDFLCNLPDTLSVPRRPHYKGAALDVKMMAESLEAFFGVKRDGTITAWTREDDVYARARAIAEECKVAHDELINLSQVTRTYIRPWETHMLNELYKLAVVYTTLAGEGGNTFRKYLKRAVKVLKMDDPGFYIHGYPHDMFVWDRLTMEAHPKWDYQMTCHKDYCSTHLQVLDGTRSRVTVHVV